MKKTNTKQFGLLVLLIGTTIAQKKDFTTSKCNAQKGNEFIAKVDACAILARQDFFSNILGGNINKATCDLVASRLECWTKVERSYDCFSEDEFANVRNNILLDDIERAKNESDFLGESYIASCRLLTNFRKTYVNSRYGPNSPCTFNEIQESLKAKKACEAEVRKKGKFLETFANSIDAWTRIFCLEHTEGLKCQEIILRCKNQQQRAITESGNQKIYDDSERKIQAINGFERFSYSNCQRSSGRKRRQAFMNDITLNLGQQEALKKIFAKRSTLMD